MLLRHKPLLTNPLIVTLATTLALSGCGNGADDSANDQLGTPQVGGASPDAGGSNNTDSSSGTDPSVNTASVSNSESTDQLDVNEPEILAQGLQPFVREKARYADTALAASLRYEGRVDDAALDATSGNLLATVLHGPLSNATLKSAAPLGTLVGKYQFQSSPPLEGALFPGWPVAILSRAGIDIPTVATKSVGTASYYESLEERKKHSHQKPWWQLFKTYQPGEIQCSNGGSMSWTANQIASSVEDERVVSWKNCQLTYTIPADINGQPKIVPDIHLDGSVRIYKTGDEFQISWDDVVYTGNGHSWNIVGTETSFGENGCGFNRSRLTHVLIEPVGAGAPVLIENFKTAIVGEDNTSRVCGASGLFQNYFDGRILHATEGAFSVSTPAHLSVLSLSTTINKEISVKAVSSIDESTKSNGILTFTGAQDSQMSVSPFIRQSLESIHNGFYKEPLSTGMEIELIQSSMAPVKYQFSTAALSHGVLADLSDSDSDGIPNAWERVYQYNPNDPSDAMLDDDSDGLNTLDEYAQSTSPLTANSVSSDASLAIVERNVGSGWVQLYGYERVANLRRKTWRVAIDIVGNVELAHHHGCVHSKASTNSYNCEWEATIDCDFDGCVYQGLQGYLQINRLDGNPITVNATLERGPLDFNQSNDVATLVLTQPNQ